MDTTTSTTAKHILDDHARSIDTLHEKLASTPGVDKVALDKAVQKYKTAHQVFTDDALGCMN